MKYLLFLLLIPSICFGEDFADRVIATLQSDAISSPKHHSPDLSDWSALYFANQQAQQRPFDAPPLIIYHARDAFDATVFQMQSDIMSRGNPYAEKPRIILDIGPGKYGRR